MRSVFADSALLIADQGTSVDVLVKKVFFSSFCMNILNIVAKKPNFDTYFRFLL